MDASCNLCEIVEIEDRTLFVKLNKPRKSNFQGVVKTYIDRPIRTALERRIVPNCHKYVDVFDQSHQREYETAMLWSSEGIRVPKVESCDESMLQLEYIPNSKTIKQIVMSDEETPDFAAFIDLYKKIRNLAFDKQDARYFHSDPHLSNFLATEENEIIPIDSGLRIKEGSLEEINASLLVNALHSITTSTHESKLDEHLSTFVDSLDKTEKDKTLPYFREPNKLAYALFQGRYKAIASFMPRAYVPSAVEKYVKNIEHIRNLLE